MKKKQILISIVIVVSFIISSILLIGFIYTTVEKGFFDAVTAHTVEMAEVTRDLGAAKVDKEIRDLKTDLQNKAVDYSDLLLTLDDKEIISLLSDINLSEYGFDFWFITDEKIIGGDSKKAEWIKKQDFSQAYESKEAFLVGPVFDEERVYTLLAAVAIYQEGEFSGLLVERIDGYCLSKWISNIKFTAGEGVAYITNSEGRNIAASRAENYDWITGEYNSIALAEQYGDEESVSVANLERKPLEGETGSGTYLWEGALSYLSYTPLTEMKGGFFVGFYGDTFAEYIKGITLQSGNVGRPLIAVVIVVFSASIVFMFYQLNKEKNQSLLLARKNKEIQGQANAIAVSEERFRLALEKTSDIIFEYQISTGDIMRFCTQDKVKHFDFEENSVHLREDLIKDAVITENSLTSFYNALNDIREGKNKAECIMSAQTTKSMRWFKMTISSVPFMNDNQTRAIGILEDITNQKEAEVDLLTQILTRSATTNSILSKLSSIKEDESSVFIILDVDYFKVVNDTYGHPVGDETLKKVAEVIKEMFKESDIIGRFGGDEFCVFRTDVISRDDVEKTVSMLCRRMKEITFDDYKNLKISCSCGIAISNSSQKSFEQIYRNADKALYTVKETHRGDYFTKIL